MVIYNMRTKRPAYNLISNNCQTFALALLDDIQVGSSRKFATSYAVYRKAIGPGSVAALFRHDAQTATLADGEAGVQAAAEVDAEADAEADAQDAAEEEVAGKPVATQKHRTIVEFARQLMEEHTTKLDSHRYVH
jgi:hypothetical protein